MDTIKIKVKGMTCKHCTMRVENALKSVESVENVNINLSTGELLIKYKSEENIYQKVSQAIENAGYSIDE